MAIKVIDTSIYKRTVSTTATHVETDIVDPSTGGYKFFSEYDTVKYVVDPSVILDKKERRMDHLYADPSIADGLDWMIKNYYVDASGNFDRSKFKF